MDDSQQNVFQTSSHPVALLCLALLKALPLALYLVGNFFTGNFILLFVFCVLTLAVDFWTTKNISGRLLVGLRWWNEVREDGTNEWIFESRDQSVPVNGGDSKTFWTALYAVPLVWSVLGVVALFGLSFKWLLIVVIAILLNAANLMGYYRCDQDQKRRWSSWTNSQGVGGLVSGLMSNAVTGGLVSRLFNRN